MDFADVPQPAPSLPEPSLRQIARDDRDYWTEREYELDDAELDEAA